jgi:hypothetical protein
MAASPLPTRRVEYALPLGKTARVFFMTTPRITTSFSPYRSGEARIQAIGVEPPEPVSAASPAEVAGVKPTSAEPRNARMATIARVI